MQISEAANILKYGMPLERLTDMILGLFMLDNIKVLSVSREMYFAATELGRDLKLDPNDALAVEAMMSRNVKEICSFDEDLKQSKELLDY